MKVGYFVETPVEHNLTGGSRSFLDLVDQLIPMKVEPYVVVHEPWALTEELEKRGIPYITTKMYRPFVGVKEKARFYRTKYLIKSIINYRSELVAAEFFRENNVQIIHINSQFCGIIGAQVAKRLRVPYVYHIREFLSEGFGVRFVNEKKADRVISQAARLIGISRSVTDSLSNRFPNTPVSLVYNGLNYDVVGCPETEKFKDEEVKMVIVGRVTDKKNQLEAVKAVELLLNKYKKKCKLLIVGFEGKDNYELHLRNYIHEHHLDNNITLIPFIDQPFHVMKQCDVGLVCSKSEAFGRVTIESMMNNLLVVASDLEATKEIIRNNEDGIIYHLGSYAELAEKINWIMEHRNDANKIAKSGRKEAIDRFSIQRTANDVMNIYQIILNR